MRTLCCPCYGRHNKQSTRISTNKSRYSQDWGNGKLTGVEKYPMAGDVSSLNSSRSISAPPRKKWYRRVPESFRRIRSQQALHDEQINHVSRRLVGAIAMWHDIHTNLLRLSVERRTSRVMDSSSSTTPGDDGSSAVSSTLSSLSASQLTLSCDEGSDENTDDNHLNPNSSLQRSSRMSLSNPELTNLQLKAMFPELSEHWRKALAKSPMIKRKAAMLDSRRKSSYKHKASSYWLDDQVGASDHLWIPSSSSHDTECYISDKGCEHIGEKRRCAACHMVVHYACVTRLRELNLHCKQSFTDPLRKKHLDSAGLHHWVNKWKHEGRCEQCGKSFQQKIWGEKEVIAVMCSWCKLSYHRKPGCFPPYKYEERCNYGELRELVVPPDWIVKAAITRKRSDKRSAEINTKQKSRTFIARPLEASASGPTYPLLVFVNPKSGGNKGVKILRTLYWLLNPRQVFDIMALKGPRYGLEMYRKLANRLRLLVCGGDGTVGWVLSTLDQLKWPVYPPMALLPLGTGNDLSRCLGWGSTFTDEPLSELCSAIVHESSVTQLDRWKLEVEPNNSEGVDCGEDLGDAVQNSLPLSVMNNYFSIGADAHVALQFHISRSANPQMLNSRFKNRIAYGGLGTIDLFRRTWRDLSEYITLECDGIDMTAKVREFKFHCVLFHNITYYAGGTVPWSNDGDDTLRPSYHDGRIEVLGFTAATLAALQMGGKGERICQCSEANITTVKPIPMQVDGEPCLLRPSTVTLTLHSTVPMLLREKKSSHTPGMKRKVKLSKSYPEGQTVSTPMIFEISVIATGRKDYEKYREANDRLRETGLMLGTIRIDAEVDLATLRQHLEDELHDSPNLPENALRDWRFLDYVTNAEEGIFRVPRHEERLHWVSDICNIHDRLMLLDYGVLSFTNLKPISNSGTITINQYESNEQRQYVENVNYLMLNGSPETHL